MRLRRVGLWLLLAGVLATTLQAERTGLRRFVMEEPWVGFPVLKFRRGDHPDWARVDLDEREWTSMRADQLPARDGVYWVRFHVARSTTAAELRHDSAIIAVVASYELYWDGRRIGSSGVVGDRADREVPGNLDSLFRIPEELAGPGDHVVALRLSSFHTGFRLPFYNLNFVVHSVQDYLHFRTRASVLAVLAAGGALVAGVGFALIWLLADRRLMVLLYSATCMAAATFEGFQVWRALFDYPYDWHYPRVLMIVMNLGLLGVLLVAFLSVFFRLKRPWLPVLAVVTLMAAAWPDERVITWMAAISLTIGLAVTVVGLRARRRGAWAVFAGLLVNGVTLLWSPADFIDQPFFLTFGAAMTGCMAAIVLQLRDDRRGARQAQLTAARLEIELLKKNIQPHFLLNTLTVLTDVIEHEPGTAVTLIEALADEFRLLARVSGERLIPLADELALCRGHLQVMSLRKKVCYRLRTENLDETALVPPAIFLTLVENGITHGRAGAGDVEFVLSAEKEGPFERYVLRTPLPEQTAAGTRRREGTGSRYLRARLEESFAGAWKFGSGPADQVWVTTVEWLRTDPGGMRA